MERLRVHYVSDAHATREPYYDIPFSERSNKLAITAPQDDVGGPVYLMQQILTPGGDQAHYLCLFQLLRQYLARSQTSCELLIKPLVQITLYSLARLGCLELFGSATSAGVQPNELDILARDDCAEARVLCLLLLKDIASSPSFIQVGLGYISVGASWLDMGIVTEQFTDYASHIGKQEKACLHLLASIHASARKEKYTVEHFLSKEVLDYIDRNTPNIYGILSHNDYHVYTPQQSMDILMSFTLDPCLEVSKAAMALLNSLLLSHGDDFLRLLIDSNTCNKLTNAMCYVLGVQIRKVRTVQQVTDWSLDSSNVYLMQRQYFEGYCAIITAMAHHLSTLSNAIESGLLTVAIVMCYFSSTFEPAIALLDSILLIDYGLTSVVYNKTLEFIHLDGCHSFVYSVLHNVVDLLSPKAKKDAISFSLSMLKNKECVQDFSRDLMGLFALVSEQKFSTMETARLFSAASQYGQNQRLIREFLDSDDEVAREILSLMNVSTSSRLHPVEQMGYKFQDLDLGWTRPL